MFLGKPHRSRHVRRGVSAIESCAGVLGGDDDDRGCIDHRNGRLSIPAGRFALPRRARWASVHGPKYQKENGKSAPTNQDVLTNAVNPRVVGLDSTQLSCTLTMSPASNPTTATVTITYNWIPELWFTSVSFTSTSVMPVTY